MRFRCIGGRARAQKRQRPTSIMRGPLGALYSCAVLFAGVTSPEELMDEKTWRAERKCRTRARAVSFYMRLVVPESYQLRAGIDGRPAECHQDRPQEEPDGEPDRGSAQVLRGVGRQYRGRGAGRIFHRRR